MEGSYPVHPASRIDTPGAHSRLEPGEVTVRGYAWAPPVGVDAVQLQVDGGPWTDATPGIDLGPDAWRPWTATWTATPGRHELRVRCRTTAGQWQEERTTTPYPHGVRGIHGVPVHVGDGTAVPAIRRLVGGAATRVTWAARSVAAWRHREAAMGQPAGPRPGGSAGARAATARRRPWGRSRGRRPRSGGGRSGSGTGSGDRDPGAAW
jgi:Bacterial Ig domain